MCGKGEKRKDEIIAPKPRRKVFIRTVEDISLLTPNDYGIPMIPKFPLVDAIIAPNIEKSYSSQIELFSFSVVAVDDDDDDDDYGDARIGIVVGLIAYKT